MRSQAGSEAGGGSSTLPLDRDEVAEACRSGLVPALASIGGNRQRFPVPHELSDDPNEARTKIELPRLHEQVVAAGRELAGELMQSVRTGEPAHTDILELRRVCGTARPPTMREFVAALEPLLAGNDRVERPPSNEIIAVIAVECLKPKGFLRNLPTDFWQSGDAIPSDAFERLQAMLRYQIVHIKELTTAREVEEAGVLPKTKTFPPAVRSTTLKSLSSMEMLEIAFPGVTRGFDPPVRPWLREAGEKWQGESGHLLASWSSAWLLEHGTRVFNRSTGSFDVDRMKSLKWASESHSHGMRGMTESSDHVKTNADIVALGAAVLTGKQIFGFSKEQLRPWDVTTVGMWEKQTDQGGRLIDDVTRYVFEVVLRKELNREGLGGTIAPRDLLAVRSPQELFNRAAPDCLRRSGLSVYQAVQRYAPAYCGFAPDQIRPWEIQRLHMWDEPRLFQQVMAFYLAREGLGTLNTVTKRYEISAAQFEEWASANKWSLKKVSDAVKGDVLGGWEKCAGANLEKAFAVLLEADSLPRFAGSEHERVARQVHRALLAMPGSRFVVDLDPAPAGGESAATATSAPAATRREVDVGAQTTLEYLHDRASRQPPRDSDQRRTINAELTRYLVDLREELLAELLHHPETLRRVVRLHTDHDISTSPRSVPLRLVEGVRSVRENVLPLRRRLLAGEDLGPDEIHLVAGQMAVRIEADRRVIPFCNQQRSALALQGREEELDTAAEVLRRIGQVTEALIDNNLPFLLHMVRGMGPDPVRSADLVLPAALAAIDDFDPFRGTQFITYLGSVLERDTQRHSVEPRFAVEIPIRLRPVISSIRSIEAGGTRLDVKDVAERFGESEAIAEQLLTLARGHDTRIDAQRDDDEAGTFELQGDAVDPGEDAVRREHATLVRGAIESIRLHDERMALVIELRAGLTDEGRLTLQEIGRRLGISRERVSQIEEDGLELLAARLRERGFEDD